MSYFSTPDSYERVYLSFDPMHCLMQERNITDLQLAKKVGVKVDVIRNTYKYQDTVTLSTIRSICEALDCGPGDLMTAGKVECIPKKRRPGRQVSVREGRAGAYSILSREAVPDLSAFFCPCTAPAPIQARQARWTVKS